MDRHYFKFGPFTLYPSRRLLERGGAGVKISGRPLDLLIALIERPGTFLSNEDLLRIVWGATAVDEGSIRVHMSGLRKAIGESHADPRCIVNVSGRGYSFVGEVERVDPGADVPRQAYSKRQALPAPVARVYGREDFCAEVADELPASRFVTIAGPGGVGKTTVALSVANDIQGRYDDGVVFVDLSTVGSGEQVPAAIMSALGAGTFAEDPMSVVQGELSRMNALLVLDSCEHVIDAAATVTEGVLRVAQAVHVLATSREALNAEGEWLRRLQPLEGPEAGGEVGASDALTYPAIEMFVSRAAANDRAFEITDGNAETIAELCRRLDGLPLAIEFAASRIEEFGLDGVAARLGDRFKLLSKGRRTALPRHRTLRQTLDWSYELLSVTEAACLRSLSMFLAPFSLWDAAAVLTLEDEQAVEGMLGQLTAKSMLSMSRDEFGTSYRLLDMTREYARLKLSEAGEAEECSLKHAIHCLELLKRAEADWNDGLTPAWLWQYGRRVWDVRQSIEWSLSKPEHISLGVQITAHSSVLYTSLGMVDQHHVELNRAIAANAGLPDPDPIMDARLFSALGNVLYQVQGHVNDDATRVAFAKAVDASRRAGDWAFVVRSLSGLSASYLIRGRHPEALALEDQLIKAGGETDHAVQRTLAHSTFFEGMMARAKGHIELALGTSVGGHGISSTGAQFDHRMVTLRSTLATYLFVAGKPESAMTVVRECVDDAASLNHPISLCHMLCGSAIPVSFALGGPSAARPFLDLLTRTARAHSIGTWMHWADCYGALIVPRSERSGTEAERVLRDATKRGANGTTVEFMSTLGLDHVEPAFVDAALDQHAKWCRPELVRLRGELNLESDGDAEAAEGTFRKALAMSVEGEMPMWELRAATSLAQILNELRQPNEATSILADVMAKFDEGHDGVDFVAAVRLRSELDR